MSLIYTKVGKSKPKKKTKAQVADELHFKKMNEKWDRMYGALTVKSKRPAEMPDLSVPVERSVRRFASRVTKGASTVPKESRKYTGDKAIGVALMHKSSYAPVFKEEEALEIARMRR